VLYRFFNIPVEIGSESAAIAEQIAALFAEFSDDSGEAPVSSYLVKCVDGGGDYEILRDCERTTTVPKGIGATPALEDTVIADLVKEVPGMLFFHAAVLARNGSAVLFPGPSGAGKSTLSLALASRGWTYLSDEVAPVNEDDLSVHPYLRAIKLRPSGFELFPFLREIREASANERQYLRLRELPITLGRGSYEVQSVVFPNYKPGGPPRLIPLPKAVEAMELAKCCFSFDLANGKTLLGIQRLVKSTDCFRFEIGEISESCDLLDSFQSATASRAPVSAIEPSHV